MTYLKTRLIFICIVKSLGMKEQDGGLTFPSAHRHVIFIFFAFFQLSFAAAANGIDSGERRQARAPFRSTRCQPELLTETRDASRVAHFLCRDALWDTISSPSWWPKSSAWGTFPTRIASPGGISCSVAEVCELTANSAAPVPFSSFLFSSFFKNSQELICTHTEMGHCICSLATKCRPFVLRELQCESCQNNCNVIEMLFVWH